MCVVCTGCAATRIVDMTPQPASVGQRVYVDLAGVIGPSSLEPGAALKFDGIPMTLAPNSSGQVGFVVPPRPLGTYAVEVKDQLGLIEILLFFPIFKDRVDTAELQIGPLRRDLGIGHVEITQGLQRDANDIPLVRGKPTVVRVYPVVADTGADIANVTGRLHASRGGLVLPDSPITADGLPVDVTTTYDRADVDRSLQFTLEPDWFDQDTDLWVEVAFTGGTDTDASNNRFPSGTETFPAVYADLGGLDIRYVKVEYSNPNWNGATLPRDRVDDQAACDWLRAIFPMDPLKVSYAPWPSPVFPFVQTTGSDLDSDQLIVQLNALFATEEDPGDRLYAWTPEGSISYNGHADMLANGGQGRVACGNDTDGANPPLTSRYRRTFAHEMGHLRNSYGFGHIDRRLLLDEFGYDTHAVDAFGRQVMRSYPSVDPEPGNSLFDFMRQGETEAHAWITPPHYQLMFNTGFAEPPASLTVSLDPPEIDISGSSGTDAAISGVSHDEANAASAFLVIGGRVTRDGSGELFPFYEIPASTTSRRQAAATPTEGSHTIRFLSATDEVLREIRWRPSFLVTDGARSSLPFTWFVPRLDAVHRVELSVYDRRVSEFLVHPEVPVLADLNLEGVDPVSRVARDEVRVSWSAQSRATLAHQVFYSRDDGVTWTLLRSLLDTPVAQVVTSRLPGCDACRIRVSSSDGYNSAALVSASFVVPNKPPKGGIVSPSGAISRARGGGVLLMGTGHDPEDGQLEDGQLAWFSSRQGELGSGSRLMVRDLSIGTHLITLRATDSEGESVDSAPVRVEILPGGRDPRP